MPRRSPGPSSPTSPTKRMSLVVCIFALSSARMIPSITARPRVSSPTPGASRRVPSFFTLIFVPSGNTVSRCAAMAISRAIASAFAKPHHISFGIHFDAGETVLFQHQHEGACAFTFHEWRCGDFCERNDFANDPVMVGADKLLGRLQPGIADDTIDRRLGRLRPERRWSAGRGK